MKLEEMQGVNLRDLVHQQPDQESDFASLMDGQAAEGEILTCWKGRNDALLPVRLAYRSLPVDKLEQAVPYLLTLSDRAPDVKASALEAELHQTRAELASVLSGESDVLASLGKEGEQLIRNSKWEELVGVWRELNEHDRLMAENLRQRNLLEKIFEVDPGGLAVITRDDLIFRMINPAYRDMLPDGINNPVGHSYLDVWPGGRGEQAARLIGQLGENDAIINEDQLQLEYPDGSQHYFSMRLHLLEWEGEPAVLQVLWETTDLKQASLAAEHSVHLAQLRASELDTVIESLPDIVLIVDEEGRVLQANPAFKATIGQEVMGLMKADMIARLKIRHPNGLPFEPQEMPAARALHGEVVRGDRMVMTEVGGKEIEVLASSSPLYQQGQLVGAVSIWSDVTELSQRRQEMEALVRVASALRNAIVQEDMFPIILSQVMELLRVDGASLVMVDQASSDLVVRLGVGAWDLVTGRRLPPGTGITSQVLTTGKPFTSNQIQNEPQLARSIFTGDLKCGLCVPLSSHGQSIGAIWVGRNTDFSEEDSRLLSAIADIAASNLYRASLFEQTQLRFQRLSALHSIDMAITSSLDLKLTLSVLLDQVVSQMQVDAADILLFDPALHWLEYASGRGFLRPAARSEPHRLTDSPAGQVAMERQIISIPDLDLTEIPKEVWLAPEEGFRSYFAAPLIAKGQVKGVLELFDRNPRQPDAEWLEFLETLATQAAIAIDGAELFERLQRINEELTVAYDATIEGWSRALELRDHETHGHAQRVTELTIRLARRIGVREEEIPYYRRGVLLHDIGKMAIPDSILLKDGPLTPEEQEIMRRHPVYAYELLYPISYLRPALDIPYSHHEWWDGSGYPRGLKGEEIPLSARIFAVVDVWDALCSDRSYRPAWPVHKVIEHIRSMSGSHFDPRVVDEFIKMVQSSERLRSVRF